MGQKGVGVPVSWRDLSRGLRSRQTWAGPRGWRAWRSPRERWGRRCWGRESDPPRVSPTRPRAPACRHPRGRRVAASSPSPPVRRPQVPPPAPPWQSGHGCQDFAPRPRAPPRSPGPVPLPPRSSLGPSPGPRPGPPPPTPVPLLPRPGAPTPARLVPARPTPGPESLRQCRLPAPERLGASCPALSSASPRHGPRPLPGPETPSLIFLPLLLAPERLVSVSSPPRS